MNEPIRLDPDMWVRLRWWQVIRWFRRCPDCRRRGWDPKTPRWEHDRVARMLGAITPDRCRACGKK